LYYQSSYELAAFKMLEQMSGVKSYDRCHFTINYEYENETRRYFPDILIEYQTGVREVIEIKPKNRLEERKNLAKQNAAKLFCDDNKFLFSIWTEDKIFARA
jgi:hypothetical protein